VRRLLESQHVGATQLLADILLAQGQADEAPTCWSGFTNTNPWPRARGWCKRCLALARDAVSMTQDEEVALTLYDRCWR
jgi:hypothetical protein